MPIKPRRLAPGARIGVVSPAYWLQPERRRRAVQVFEALGFEVIPGETTNLRDNKYAGSAKARAADIMAMFLDDSIDAIICARGGYGGNRVLPLLDYDVIRRHPKIIVGFSDLTACLSSIAQHAGLVTFHGPMLTTFGEQTLGYNVDTLRAVLSGDDNIRIASPEACRARTLRPGVASGPLWGGNLMLVINRLGTPDQIDTRGAILFLEEIDEELYAFDRLMMHLKAAGSFDKIKGLVMGELLAMRDSNVAFGKDSDEIVLDVCGEFEFPIVSNFPCGHGDYQATLPISHDVELHADDNPYILIPESPVH